MAGYGHQKEQKWSGNVGSIWLNRISWVDLLSGFDVHMSIFFIVG